MNCTVTAHSGSYYGAGIYSGGTLSICNSILWGNRGHWGRCTAEDQVWHSATGFSISRFLIQGQTNLTQGDTGYDPCFVEPTARNFSLSPWSPAVDVGFSPWVAGLATDAKSAIRLVGPEVDMGAFESATAEEEVQLTQVPLSVSTCFGSTANFTVGGATNYTFYWQVDFGAGFVNATNGGEFTITHTINASTLSIAHVTLPMSGWRFRCGLAGSGFVRSPRNFGLLRSRWSMVMRRPPEPTTARIGPTRLQTCRRRGCRARLRGDLGSAGRV